MNMFCRRGVVTAVCVMLGACFWRGSERATDALPRAADGQYKRVALAWLSPAAPGDELDSIAGWAAPDATQWVIVSDKRGNRLRVFDGESGAPLRSFGGPGARPGEFSYPNGLAVIDDLLFVVERDNRRVQVLRLPDFLPLATFGEPDLRSPYGITVRALAAGEYELLVTDSYMTELHFNVVPPLTQLDARVKRYRLEADGAYVGVQLQQVFGDTTAAGALRKVESITVDAFHQRILIAEEDRSVGTALRAYTLNGEYSGRDVGFGTLRAQAEGIALWACADGSGYWIVADQFPERTVFQVFDRRALTRIGAFANNRVANTDGIWLRQTASLRFPEGVLFAVHDDKAIAAFDWRAIARVLQLPARCDAQ